MQINMDEILEILHHYPCEVRHSLAIMQGLQHHFNYIPREGMEALADGG